MVVIIAKRKSDMEFVFVLLDLEVEGKSLLEEEDIKELDGLCW